jgi:hypothetical protein
MILWGLEGREYSVFRSSYIRWKEGGWDVLSCESCLDHAAAIVQADWNIITLHYCLLALFFLRL